MPELADLVLVFPDPPPPVLVRTLDLAGQRWKAVANSGDRDARRAGRRLDGQRSCAPKTIPKAHSALCRSLRKGDARVESILLLVSGAQLHELEHRDDLFDDFCLSPFHPKEIEPRFRHLLFRAGRGDSPELASYADLVLNFETYQAAIGGKPLDLTYMEYELLKFFLTHPGKVFTREQLLSRVWGYEYYAARHGRRSRAAFARQARRGARQPDPDGAVGRLSLRPGAAPAREHEPSGTRSLSVGVVALVDVAADQPAEDRRPDRHDEEEPDRPGDEHHDQDQHDADHGATVAGR